jgi:hypothetical protein
LSNGQAPRDRKLLNRRCRFAQAAAGRPVGLRQDKDDFMTRGEDRLQRSRRELRSPRED